MKTTTLVSLTIVVAVVFAVTGAAQSQTPSIEVTTDKDRAQFAVHGQARALHLAVFSRAGELLFETESAAGQAAEWRMVNNKGERVADGVYLATVTVTDLLGERRKRTEQVVVSSETQAEQALAAEAVSLTPVGPISGQGIAGKLAKFTGVTSIGDSVLTESISKIGVNSIPTATLQINGLQPAALATNGTNAPALLLTSGGKGGNTTGTTGQLPGAGASILLVAGNGGDGPTGNGGRGGDITLQPGLYGGASDLKSLIGNVLIAPTGAGRVGIGTASPTSTLTVAGGDIKIVTPNAGVVFSDGTAQTTAGLSVVARDATLTGKGWPGLPLGVNVPLALSASNPNPILAVTNTGSGAAISATGAINTTKQYNIGGQRVLSVQGAENLFAGVNAGVSNTDGRSNSFFGWEAGLSNTTGFNNSFFGAYAGNLNTSGYGNSFFGSTAGHNNTGNGNSFFGSYAGVVNQSGANNSFFGASAGQRNEAGSSNSFFGESAGTENRSGSYNSFFGQSAGQANTAGVNNSFFGQSAGLSNQTGNYNSFFGASAGRANIGGGFNSFFGQSAGFLNQTGANNSYFGANAGRNNKAGSGNSFFGQNAGISNTANNNSFFGVNSGQANWIGTDNSFFGASAGVSNQEGSSNSFFGTAAGGSNKSGNYNSFFGSEAGGANQSGNNSFFGALAGRSSTGGNNSFFGLLAGSQDTGSGNAFFGSFAGYSHTSGGGNTFIGSNADGSAAVMNATAIGANAKVTQDNSLVLGSTNVNVGIGTSAPKARLDVESGDLLVGSAGQGLILKSPDGRRCARLTIDNAGVLLTSAIACP